MKYIILFLSVLFTTLTVKSQDLDKIKSQNVYFILFDKNDMLSKSGCIKRGKNEDWCYHFYKKTKVKFDFYFCYSKYPTFDDEYNEINQSMLFRINKKFLRKNRDIIITRELIEKMGEKALIRLMREINIHIFLIDKGEIKNNKILVREVSFYFTAEI